MKRSFSFFVLALVTCGLFYFKKTQTQKDNQMRVMEVVTLKDECDKKLQDIAEQKDALNTKLDELKQAIDKNNEDISKNDNKIKTLTKNPRNKKTVDELKKKNTELADDVNAKNSEIEAISAQVDAILNKESALGVWRQKAFTVLEKTQSGDLSDEDKKNLSAVAAEFKNLDEAPVAPQDEATPAPEAPATSEEKKS